MPKEFDGAKFAARYKLDARGDFWSDGKLLYVPDNLPDDPPIFELPDPPQPSLTSRIQAMTAQQLTTNLKSILLEIIKGR